MMQPLSKYPQPQRPNSPDALEMAIYPIAPSAPSKSNEPKRVNLGGGERRTTTKWWL